MPKCSDAWRLQYIAELDTTVGEENTGTAVAEDVEPGAWAGDLLDDLNLDGVGDAVADDFLLYSFNCIAEKSVPKLSLYLRYHHGIWWKGSCIMGWGVLP